MIDTGLTPEEIKKFNESLQKGFDEELKKNPEKYC